MLTVRQAVLVLALLLSQPALAGAQAVPEICMSPHEDLCLLWVGGANSMYAFIAAITDHRGYCVPDGVTNLQLVRIFQAYLRANPARWHEQSAGLLALALQEKYPCR